MKTFLFFTILLVSLFSYGQESNPDLDKLKALYQLQEFFERGLAKGKEMNTAALRSVSDATTVPSLHQEFLETASSKFYLVTNFFHDGKFYIAKIPKNSLSGLFFLKEPFGIKLLMAHFMLRFEFSEPIQLVAEVPNLKELNKGITKKT